MSKDQWLSLAMIVAVVFTALATLLGPVLAVFAQVRLTRPPRPVIVEPTHGRLLRTFFQIDAWLMRHRFFFFVVGLSGSYLLLLSGTVVSVLRGGLAPQFLIVYGIVFNNLCIGCWLHFNLVERVNRLRTELAEIQKKADVQE